MLLNSKMAKSFSSIESKLPLMCSSKDQLSLDEIDNELQLIKFRIDSEFKNDPVLLKKLNQILQDLACFEFGRFLIKNKGALSGGWTYYIILGYAKRSIESELERFLLNKSPVILATRERFHIFNYLLQQNIRSNHTVCSVPCGVMADLTLLDLSPEIFDVTFVGIDLDQSVLNTASELTRTINNTNNIKFEFYERDAWKLGFDEQFDLITTNGLNLYIKDDSKVIDLYKEFFKALRPKGILIGSALSVPPTISKEDSEWDTKRIDSENLLKQSYIFGHVLNASWQNFRTSKQSIYQLECAGFKDVEIHWDRQKIFYSFSAKKR